MAKKPDIGNFVNPVAFLADNSVTTSAEFGCQDHPKTFPLDTPPNVRYERGLARISHISSATQADLAAFYGRAPKFVRDGPVGRLMRDFGPRMQRWSAEIDKRPGSVAFGRPFALPPCAIFPDVPRSAQNRPGEKSPPFGRFFIGAIGS